MKRFGRCSIDTEKTGFLEESPRKFSAMRLMCLMSFVVSVPFAYMELKAGSGFPYITTMYLTAAFAPKSVQKFAETKK